MSDTPFDAPVCVTGATGYIAGWVVRDLLERGAVVHGTVRDPGNAAKVAHLRAMEAELPGTLRLFGADLLDDGSFDEAVAACGTVIHTASPFFLTGIEDAEAQLVAPARQGTANVLGSVDRAESVHRVVVTSSAAAIYCDAADVTEAGRALTEADWNTRASATYRPYAYSKTVAERTAWEIHDAQDRWSLATINPTFVMGPSTSGRTDGTSVSYVKDMLDGTRRTGMPRWSVGLVDVRDVAAAHVAAAIDLDAAGRFICCAETTDHMTIAGWLREAFGADGYPIPKRAIPGFLLYLAGPFNGFPWTMVRRSNGHDLRFDTRRSREVLGLEYRSARDAVVAVAQQVIDSGAVSPPG